jgi:hypothetical protein
VCVHAYGCVEFICNDVISLSLSLSHHWRVVLLDRNQVLHALVQPHGILHEAVTVLLGMAAHGVAWGCMGLHGSAWQRMGMGIRR